MVFYFEPRGEAGHVLYMGRDKGENEELIAHGVPEDVWFHVDKLSSAHVYLRLERGQSIDDITPEQLEDCAQLVKANSITGNKTDELDVVYTPWENLKKEARMEVGQVGFFKQKAVRRVHVKTRENVIVNRLNKTKREEYPDLKAQREEYDRVLKAERKKAYLAEMDRKKEEAKQHEEEKKLRSYTGVMDTDNMTSNKELAAKFASVEDFEEDFM